MFSKKFQKELYEEKYNSMKQLDRIEFQNNTNSQNIIECSLVVLQMVLLIGMVICLLSISAAAASLDNTKEYGLIENNIIDHMCIIIFVTFLLVIFYLYIYYLSSKIQKKYKEENEKFLEERGK